MKKIYVCSPLRGDIDKNIENARQYSRLVVKEGHIPVTPHIYFTQFLDDTNPEERKLGTEMGLTLLLGCHELWVFGSIISEGMRNEINHFTKYNGGKIYFK